MAKRDFEYGYQKAMQAQMAEDAANQRKQVPSIWDRATNIGAASAVSGGLIGGALSLLTRGGIGRLLRNAALGAAGAGGIAAGANVAGTPLVSGDEETDASINTRRGLVGGGLVGSAAGAGLGVAATNPRLHSAVTRSPIATRAIRAAGIAPEASSLLQRGIALARRNPYGAVAGGILGALGGAGAGAFLGADEGMQYDVLMQEMRRRQ